MVESHDPPIEPKSSYLNLSMAISAVPALICSKGRTYIRFEEYQLYRSQIGLSPTILSSLDNTATLTHSTYLLVWPRIDHRVSGLIIVTMSRTTRKNTFFRYYRFVSRFC